MCAEKISAIYTGRNLGRGSFCVVKEVMEIRNDDKWNHDERSKYFALKQPRSDLSSALEKKVRMELQNEIEILSKLNHEYIIQVRRVNIRGPSSVYLAMEKLPLTLNSKIKLWKTQRTKAKKLRLPRRQSYPSMSDLRTEMIGVIRDIAHAMRYIHSEDFILRDLKPNNIGFDINGTLKLFDFGLARKLKNDPAHRIGIDQYLLEQGVGTLRYMCPEVALGRPYGKPCDVYSFALVAWEILTLEKPYATMNPQSLHEQVYEQQQRPKVDKKWPAEIQCLLHRSWYNNPRYRPQFSEICELIAGLHNANERHPAKINDFVRRMCRSNNV